MTIPIERLGIGLRTPHYSDFIHQKPSLALVELHSENHFSTDGAARDIALQAAEIAPLSLHGVGLSLGSADGLDKQHLRILNELVTEVNPNLISEHLCWSRIGNIHTHDLLPLPFCKEAIDVLSNNIDQVQQTLGREILIENISSYISFDENTMPEWEFVAAVIERANCSLLLDVNNMYVNSKNHQFKMSDYISGLPWSNVKEIHVAGHQQDGNVLIDTHDRPVCDDVKKWLNIAASKCSQHIPIVLEWDSKLPSFDALLDHMAALASYNEEKTHAMA